MPCLATAGQRVTQTGQRGGVFIECLVGQPQAFPQAGEIVNLYGPTETTMAKFNNSLGELEDVLVNLKSLTGDMAAGKGNLGNRVGYE